MKTALTPEQLLEEFDLATLLNTREIDEVWVVGQQEPASVMGGLRPFWLGKVPVQTRGIARRFPFMLFSDNESFLHTYGHRIESIFYHVYRGYPPAKNMWERFIRTEKTNPGRSGVGTIHCPPHGIEMGWASKKKVYSDCHDWKTYPILQGRSSLVSGEEWNYTQDGYIKWWMRHLPRGNHKTDGIHNNWWAYVMNLDLVR
jgi:hypothetical protein